MLDGKHGLSLAEIAKRLNISEKDMFRAYNDLNTQVRTYYDGGRALGTTETDKALYDLAKNGSSTAKQAYDEKLKQANLRNEFQIIDES